MISTELCGILLMISTGICVTSEMVTSKLIEASGWPYWYLLAGSSLLATIFNGLALWWRRTEVPARSDLKWVLARSVFEDLHWYGAILAVILGAAPGDVAALTSIDIIAAALLGLVFLGEQVSFVHFLALGLSAAGAILISQPEFIFGFTSPNRSPVGYVLALLSGCFQACSFVCARKSAHISIGVLTFCSLLLSVPMGLVPTLLPMKHQASWQLVADHPWQALGLLLLLTFWTMFSIMLPAAGATRCPAAVSATVFTSSCMVSGYLAQILLFQELPQLLTVLGAGAMLLSVVLMAVPCNSAEPCEEPKVSETETAATDAMDDTLSLGSFVASEVSFCSSSSRVRLRLKRFTTKTHDLVQRIGAALPAGPVGKDALLRRVRDFQHGKCEVAESRAHCPFSLVVITLRQRQSVSSRAFAVPTFAPADLLSAQPELCHGPARKPSRDADSLWFLHGAAVRLARAEVPEDISAALGLARMASPSSAPLPSEVFSFRANLEQPVQKEQRFLREIPALPDPQCTWLPLLMWLPKESVCAAVDCPLLQSPRCAALAASRLQLLVLAGHLAEHCHIQLNQRKAKARAAPAMLRPALRSAYVHRWSGLLSEAASTAFAESSPDVSRLSALREGSWRRVDSCLHAAETAVPDDLRSNVTKFRGHSHKQHIRYFEVIDHKGWPYWYLLACACLVASLATGAVLWFLGTGLPSSSELKWVLSRSIFGDLHWYLAILAVILGAAPGDVAALTSIDITAAALLGLVFLGEKVSWLHFVALGLSTAGAICIAQPEFLFGFTTPNRCPEGYVLALLAGCFQAGSFVCARKSVHVSCAVLSLSSMLMSVPMSLVPPMLPGRHDSWQGMSEQPWMMLGLLALLTAWTALSITLPAAGSTRCPAAVSATVFTSSCMVSGYLSQMLFFQAARNAKTRIQRTTNQEACVATGFHAPFAQEMPQCLTLVGAACMLLSVMLMAIPCAKPTESETEPKVDSEAEVAGETTMEDETLSLGSFVASEFSFGSSSSHAQRRLKSLTNGTLSQRIGAALPVATLSA
ncbi:unnamed protein product [Effrenium voratum]|nr:unnamed protein product [Effrenium voratum]